MPTYTLPQINGEDDRDGIAPIDPAGTVRDEYTFPDEWDRRVSIPVNDAILAALAVGDPATVTLRCRVEEMTRNQSRTGAGRTNITVSIDAVDAYSNDAAASEDMFEAGFMRNRKSYRNRF